MEPIWEEFSIDLEEKYGRSRRRPTQQMSEHINAPLMARLRGPGVQCSSSSNLRCVLYIYSKCCKYTAAKKVCSEITLSIGERSPMKWRRCWCWTGSRSVWIWMEVGRLIICKEGTHFLKRAFFHTPVTRAGQSRSQPLDSDRPFGFFPWVRFPSPAPLPASAGQCQPMSCACSAVQ
jgi:hypothetical protein